MGHIAHLRTQFKSINIFAQSYDFTKMLIWKRKLHHLIFDYWKVLKLISKNPHPHNPRGVYVPSLVEIDQIDLDKKILYLLFCNYLPLEKVMVLHLYKLEFPSQLKMLCAKFGWNWPDGSGEAVRCLNFVNVFSLFCNYMYIPLEKSVFLYFNKLEFPATKDSLCQV